MSPVVVRGRYSRPARIGIIIVPMKLKGGSVGCIALKLCRLTLFALVVICSMAIFRYESITLQLHTTLLEVENVTDPVQFQSLRFERLLTDEPGRDGIAPKVAPSLTASYNANETARKQIRRIENNLSAVAMTPGVIAIDTKQYRDGIAPKVEPSLTASYNANKKARKKIRRIESNRSAVAIRPGVIAIDTKQWMLSYFSSKTCRKPSPDYQPPSWLKQMFVLIGVHKGGTKAIHTFLEENPQFVARCADQSYTRELHFFNNISGANEMKDMDQGELQTEYSNLIQSNCPAATAALMNDTNKMYLDDTPLYIQDSHLIPQFLNCVMPKTKIMAVLRNPTDRAFSHYNFYLERDWCRSKTFDEWVDLNIQELNQSGVLTAKNTFEELLAWGRYNTNYQGARRCKTVVTRGMYAVQLLHYITALKAAGRPRSDLHVIRSEDLQGSMRQIEYNKILRFLGLPPHKLKKRKKTVHKTVYESSMDASSREKLDKFFRPYNQRLYELLGWDPVWG